MKRLLFLALALSVALPALAQTPVAVAKESPRWGSFQISLAPYQPNIDREFGGGSGPYSTIFGASRPVMVQAIFSRSILADEIGALDAGFGAGYWQVWGTGIYQAAGGAVMRGGSTTLMVIPLSLSLTYRVDWFWTRFGVPLAPYARGQLVDYIWETKGQNGVSSWTSSTTGDAYRGAGATFGILGTLGVGIVLDFFDPSLARQMDYDVGINSTMAFIDFTKGSVNDFGGKNSWQLATSYWMWSAGLLFVF